MRVATIIKPSLRRVESLLPERDMLAWAITIYSSSESGDVMMRNRQKLNSVKMVPIDTLIITSAVVVMFSPAGFQYAI